jgi:superfamily II DNA or RNA helicase
VDVVIESGAPGRYSPTTLSTPAEATPGWERCLDAWSEPLGAHVPVGEVEYRLDLRETRLRDALVVGFFDRTGAGAQVLPIDERSLDRLPDPMDRQLLGMLLGGGPESGEGPRLPAPAGFTRTVLRPGLFETVLPELCATGRFRLDGGLGERHLSRPLAWDGERPFRCELRFGSSGLQDLELSAQLFREDERIGVDTPRVFLASGLGLVDDERLIWVRPRFEAEWACRVRRAGGIRVPFEQKDAFLTRLAQLPELPELSLPPELHWTKLRPEPEAALSLVAHEKGGWMADVLFFYGEVRVRGDDDCHWVPDPAGRKLLRRNREAETRLRRALLGASGVEAGAEGHRLPASRVTEVISRVLQAGFRVESEGRPVRVPKGVKGRVTSGIDWFDLDAEVVFDGDSLSLPELLEAARAGKSFVRLSDGSQGWVPDWLDRYAAVAQAGRIERGSLRFNPAQAGLLDALVSTAEVETDVKFDRLRRAIEKRPTEVGEPEGFRGRLRSYQRQGLAWMCWLDQLGCSGCLADDMGLGKTVQVLSWLQYRHGPGASPAGPSLIVVPKSLVYNWRREAEKFTSLRVLTYAGSTAERARLREQFEECDLVVTTYGALRSDILELLDVRFEVLVADEAQALKNPRSQASKAVRLVRSERRLAISGTPIENGLNELWSLFDFLNPGMLGSLDDFDAPGRGNDEDWLGMLSKALRPFMLRRTKEQVLDELPGKTEQTLWVELSDVERRRYDELRTYYRVHLTDKVAASGWGAAKIHVLEALLRLRQASCHPGLVDPERADESSAKLEVLLERLREAVSRGRKCLVFSQFTGLLDIVRRALERHGIGYAYLDGQTRDREKAVEEFKANPEQAVFLISLKAGGCGLNLTQSDVVFILDPWWNPAVEAQAIDRAHRMGQARHVMAYRLIGRGTVEEKIANLQDEKRRLADAVVEGAPPLEDLQWSDVEMWLATESSANEDARRMPLD